MTVSIAELMQKMIDAGAPIDAVMIAVKAIEDTKTELQSQIDHNRATTRERVRKHRENKQLGGCNVTETLQKRNGNVTVTSRAGVTRVENNLLTKKIIDQEERKKETREERKKETRAGALVVSSEAELTDAGVEAETLNAWKGVRKEKRSGPISKPVVDALRREAAKAGLTLQQVVTICCERGWQGFKADWLIEARASGPPQGRRTASHAFMELAREQKKQESPYDNLVDFSESLRAPRLISG